MLPHTVPDDTWGSELADYSAAAAAEFWGLVSDRSIVGRLTRPRKTPPRIRTVIASSGSSAVWLGKRQPIPVSKMGFDATPLDDLKIAGLVVITIELAKSSNPRAEGIIQQDLAQAIRLTLDGAFLSDNPGVPDVSPPGLLFGVTATPATGFKSLRVRGRLKEIP